MKQQAKLFILSCICFLSVTVTAQNPNLQWVKSFGSTSNDGITSVITDASGNVYYSGTVSGSSDLDPGPGVTTFSNGFLAKMDVSGNFMWAIGLVQGGVLCFDPSGNICVSGVYWGTFDFDPGAANYTLSSAGGADVYVAKYTIAGNFVWAASMGGPSPDISEGVISDASGNLYTTGYFQGVSDFDPSAATYTLSSTGTSYNMFVSKLDAAGNFAWAKRMGGNGQTMPSGITIDAAGNTYLTGGFSYTTDLDPGPAIYSFTSSGGSFIEKLDVSGNFIWAKSLGGAGGGAICMDAAGDICMTGRFANVVDFDPSVSTATLDAQGASRGFIAKYDANGNYIFAEGLFGSNTTAANSITTDASNNIYLTGYLAGSCDMDPGTGSYSLTATAINDIFALKLNSSGNFVWAVSMVGSLSYNSGNGISVTPSGDIFIGGSFTYTVDFDPGAGTVNLTSNGSSTSDAFILKLNGLSTSLRANAASSLITFFPNPSSGTIHISFGKNISKGLVTITNSVGERVHTENINNGNKVTVDVNSLSEGIYFLIIYDENKILGTEKIIIQK